MKRLIGMFYFESSSIDEYHILENIGNLFFRFGDSVSVDEKLFIYSGVSGFVRMCI